MIRFISNKIAKIIGGTIDNTVIGGTTPAPGSFTNITSTQDTVLGGSSTDGRRLRVTKDSADLDVKFDTTISGKAALIISGYEANTNLATTSSGAKLTLQNSNGTAGNYSSIIGVDSVGATMSQIAFVNVDHTNNEGEIAFFTRPSGGSITERMRIDSSGNFFIGTIYPNASASYDLGSSSKTFKDLYLSGGVYVGNKVEFPWSSSDTFTIGLAQKETNTFSTNTSVLEIHGADAVSGAQAMAGGDVRLRGGYGYGTAAGDAGNVIIQAGAGLPSFAVTPGVIKFETGSTATERMRIDSSGHLLVGTTDNTPYNNSTSAGTGTSIGPNGQIWNHADNGDLGTWNRTGSDGSIFLINRDGSTVATVSVSSGTVTWGTFCGGHNSQFADKSQPEIERGTVMASIDELVEWKTVRWTQTVTEAREIDGELQQVEIDLPKQADYYGAEPVGAVFTDDDGNEKTVHAKQADQLPKCEVSTTEGDKMVYGTFSHYDENGTPIIHSLGQTVVKVTGPIEAGDLLMSKGDGTACKWVESYGYAAILGKCRQGAPSAAQNDVNLLAYTSMAG